MQTEYKRVSIIKSNMHSNMFIAIHSAYYGKYHTNFLAAICTGSHTGENGGA